jgi:hypothetical protein
MNDKIPSSAGKYGLLYKYLRDRYADRLVLTFGQIEDLLGFALPEAASVERAWWDANPTTEDPQPSKPWTLANRTATVNLPARTVLFERLSPERAPA